MRGWMVGMGLMLMAAPLRAQEADPGDTGNAPMLRRRIEERVAARVQEELQLSNEQAGRLRATMANFAARRRSLEADQRQLRAALAGQLRPGVAADQDSVSRLTNTLAGQKVKYAETYRDELRAMSYLSPVQRAQFFVIRERLLQRLAEVREQRQERQGDAPGALRPRRHLRR